MASKTPTSTTRTGSKARAFDILLPRLGRAGEGAVFEAGSYVRRQGQVPAMLQAVSLSGSPPGTHAASKDASTSLCGLSTSPLSRGDPAAD